MPLRQAVPLLLDSQLYKARGSPLVNCTSSLPLPCSSHPRTPHPTASCSNSPRGASRGAGSLPSPLLTRRESAGPAPRPSRRRPWSLPLSRAAADPSRASRGASRCCCACCCPGRPRCPLWARPPGYPSPEPSAARAVATRSFPGAAPSWKLGGRAASWGVTWPRHGPRRRPGVWTTWWASGRPTGCCG